MNAKTLEAITRHGESLLKAFPNCTEKNPVALCKKLRRIETSISKVIMDYSCEPGRVTQDQLDHACQLALIRTGNLFGLDANGIKAHGLFVNRDPRGYALKLDNEPGCWFPEWQNQQYASRLPALHTDMAQYGIIAPDLTSED